MIFFCLVATPVWGQGASTDPSAASPAGTVYRLPLDDARGDAAPRRPPKGGDGPSSARSPRADASPVRRPAPLRSENGFGSSSTVPGVTAGDRGVTDDAPAGGSRGATSNRRAGTGAGSDVSRSPGRDVDRRRVTGDPAIRSADATAGARTSAVGDEPSKLAMLALLALVLVAGVAAALVTRRRGRAS